MNDPHVVALVYDIETAPWIDYDRAPPLKTSRGDLLIEVGNGQARIAFNGPHYATSDEAREAIHGLVTGWELLAGLTHGPGAFSLKFKEADVVDRAPGSGKVAKASGAAALIFWGKGGARASVSRYPEPPPTLVVSDTLVQMYSRYAGYRQGRVPLSMAAYFCFDSLKRLGRGKRGAADKFCVGETVLRKLSELASTKGGTEARKADGALVDWTPRERQWLEAAMVMLIRRLAEREAQSAATLRQITMAHLPPI